MQGKSQNLSSGLEDYIETIYISHLNNQVLKGAQLARKLNISRASVSEAIAKLVEKNLIKYNSYEPIFLTEKGIEEAKKIYNKHSILKDFFEKVLDISQEEASENACKMEHIISEKILHRLLLLTEYCDSNQEILTHYKEEIVDNG